MWLRCQAAAGRRLFGRHYHVDDEIDVLGRRGRYIQSLDGVLDGRHGFRRRADRHYMHVPIGLDADRKSTRLNSSHLGISYAVFCLKKKKGRPQWPHHRSRSLVLGQPRSPESRSRDGVSPIIGTVSRAASPRRPRLFFFFFNDTATTEIYTLSLHDALPISPVSRPSSFSFSIRGRHG